MTTPARSTAERLHLQYDDRKVTLAVDAGTAAATVCDPDRIIQVLVNLLGNALGSCDRHGHVALSVHGEPSPGHHVIVRGVARAQGGDITAESDGLGKGATFTLRLPQDAH
ncbi:MULTISPECIES: hypothetical protein [unclassified Streptomyces]|uniref:hypothetical protein n=1 Tax=unclassified Streptomyces TaxID=2593676 RepID=UPI0036EE247A